MITDPIFYRLFGISPETFFLLLGMSDDRAKELATQYDYAAIEFKETAHRSDGVFRPKEAGLPLYFLEVQFYPLASVYADLLVKAYTYLKQHDPGQAYCGVVLFGSRTLEPTDLAPYQLLLNGGLLRRFYLDEMPELPNAPLGLSILSLLGQAENQAPAQARELIARTKKEIKDSGLQADLVELIETVIFYKLPTLSWEEIQTMLQVDDIRKTRVYQEAVEEGIEKERRRSFEEQLRAISKMTARNMSAAEIADILGLNEELVSQRMAKSPAIGEVDRCRPS